MKITWVNEPSPEALQRAYAYIIKIIIRDGYLDKNEKQKKD